MKKSMPCHKHASCAMPLRIQPSLGSSVRYQRIRPAVRGLRPRLGRRCATSISMSQPAPLWQGHRSHPGMTRATDDGEHPKAPISYTYDVLWRLRADRCLYATTRDSWLSCLLQRAHSRSWLGMLKQQAVTQRAVFACPCLAGRAWSPSHATNAVSSPSCRAL